MQKLPDILAITISHDGTPITLDPNNLALMATTPHVFHSVLRPLPYLKSDISNKRGGVIFKDHDGELKLTIEELTRLAGNRLTPKEYFALRWKFGSRFMWHDDFYHPVTGEALQPRFHTEQ